MPEAATGERMMTMASKLQSWRADVVTWAEECVWTKDPTTGILGPVRLQEHQVDFLREATRRDADGCFARKVCVASWPKREGKTLCVAIILAWRLSCYTDQRAGIIANSERQAASNIFDAVTGFFKDSPHLQGLVPDEFFQAKRLTVPALNNVAECFPCNHRTVQGTRFDVLACDELHAADDGGKAYTFASQQTEARDAQVLISSQAGAPVESNPLWRLYGAGEAGESHILFSYRQDPVTPWARARAEKAKAELLPGEYDYLWRNAWGATGMKLLDVADLQAAAMDYETPASAEEWRGMLSSWGLQVAAIGAGLDRAGVSRRGDASVWTTTARFDSDEGMSFYRVVQCEVLPTGAESEVMEAAGKCWAIFGPPNRVLLEYYGCSDIVEKIPGAELVSPTSQKQQAAFNHLHRLFVERRIGFAAGCGVDRKTQAPGLLKAELLAFEYDCERGGLSVFGTQRGHDDTVYSALWSVEAATSAEIEEETICTIDDLLPGFAPERLGMARYD